ncbi:MULTISPECIES: hypothetical protein [unclassified Agrococcus]|uniref:DUF7882 family protein n=1 Tax=unclassified Agrococcus TaxID=2615065 RepID=UPI0036132F91
MGILTYGGSTAYEIDDRTLAHLRAVIVAKLRQHQHFELSWTVEAHAGSGRVALTIDPAIPLEFSFRSAQPERLNPRWTQALMEGANSPRGLVLMTEAESQEPQALDRA